MSVSLKIWDKNVEKYQENISLVSGIAETKKGTKYIEYQASKSKENRILKVERNGLGEILIEHTCAATKKCIPCWHLGAVAVVAKIPSLPQIISLNDVNPTIPSEILYDVTDRFLGRPGKFDILNVETEPVTDTDNKTNETGETNKVSGFPDFPPDVNIPSEDIWLKRYNLPAKLLDKLLFFREKQKQILIDEQRTRIPNAEYIPSGSEVIYSIASLLYGNEGKEWEAPLFVGPKGSGKSTLAETLAAMLMIPVNKIFGGIDVNAEALLGSKTLVPTEGIDIITEAKLRAACKQSGIDPDPLVQKLRNSQLKIGFEPGLLLNSVLLGEMLVIDEVNMLIPEVTSLLHGLLDWQKTLAVPGNGVVKAPESFRLIGCMNYGYAGTKPLNEAFQDRFRSIQVPHLPEEKLTELIVNKTACFNSVAEKLAKLFSSLAGRVKNGDISERVLSIRGLFRIAREEMDGVGDLKKITISVMTEGIGDKYEVDQIKDICDACI